MAQGVQFKLTYANGQTMDKFSQVIAARMKWCNESARDSIAACAIDALKSIRTKCKVAKKSSVKVDVKVDNTLRIGFKNEGGRKKPVVCYSGTNKEYAGEERIRFAERAAPTSKVFRFSDTYGGHDYIVVANSISVAKAEAKKIVCRRALRYSGLARRALGFLMQKTYTKRVNDPFNPVVEEKADAVTLKREVTTETKEGGARYGLILTDCLKYALDSIKGGKAEVDACLKRAMNKIVSVVNQKIKKRKNDFFAPAPLATPFPEMKQRKK